MSVRTHRYYIDFRIIHLFGYEHIIRLLPLNVVTAALVSEPVPLALEWIDIESVGICLGTGCLLDFSHV